LRNGAVAVLASDNGGSSGGEGGKAEDDGGERELHLDDWVGGVLEMFIKRGSRKGIIKWNPTGGGRIEADREKSCCGGCNSSSWAEEQKKEPAT
jgi:hypothetical protein